MSGDAAITADSAAELQKLAHVLDVPETALQMVAGLPVADLRTLRSQIGEALFQADRHHFTRVAALSKAVPTSVAAKLTEAVLPPLLAARTTELLEPSRAVDMIGSISDRYLADVAAVMDAARAPQVIAAIPPARVAEVGAELARRREWVVIGGFVALVSDAALATSIAVYTGEQLLRIAFVLEDLSRVDAIGALLSDRQIDDIIAAAAGSQLWNELAELLDNLSDEQTARLAAGYARAGDDVHATVEKASADGALPDAVLERLQGS